MKHLKKIFLLIAFAVFSLVLVLFVPKVLKINNIVCISQYGACSEEIQKRIVVCDGCGLGEAREKLIGLLSKNSQVESYLIQYKFPGDLVVNIVEVKPFFAMAEVGGSGFVLVGEDGRVLSAADTTNLPYILVSGDLPLVSENVGEKNLFALKVLESVYYSYQAKVGEIVNNSLAIDLPTGLSVLFPLEGDREVLVGSLIAIYERLNTDHKEFTIDGKMTFAVIDLRFKNPVIR